MPHVLILGGTGEARALAARLAGTAWTVTSSLAGRVSAPLLPVGGVRIGGFGGVDGLVTWVRTHRVDAIVDATHPFAAHMSAHAAAAGARTGVPLRVLRRPGWREQPGDRWQRVPTLTDAATAASGYRRLLLSTGRQSLPAFTGLGDCWLLARMVQAPDETPPAHVTVLLDRGPFTVAGELTLLREHRIDAVVTKDSGGPATEAKLVAARELGLPVVMVDRPPLPTGVATVADEQSAAAWLLASS